MAMLSDGTLATPITREGKNQMPTEKTWEKEMNFDGTKFMLADLIHHAERAMKSQGGVSWSINLRRDNPGEVHLTINKPVTMTGVVIGVLGFGGSGETP